MPDQSVATSSSVTKIVKLGASTLLVVDLGPNSDVPEGEYLLRDITVAPRSDMPSAAGTCIIKCVGKD